MRNIIDTWVENDFETVIIGKDIFNPAENFPLNDSVEVVLRTLRRCLDKVGDRIQNIIIAIDEEIIFNTVIFYMKIFFPRNEDEQRKYKKFIKNQPETEYGDLVLETRKIEVNKHIKENDFVIRNTVGYNDLANFSFEELSNKNDSQRIKEIFNEDVDFAKKFYYENIPKLNIELDTKFENLNFISYKGTDQGKRQIFFIYLKLINFPKLEEHKIEKDFLLYCYNCKYSLYKIPVFR